MLKLLSMIFFACGVALAAISAATPRGEEIWWLFAIGVGLIIVGIFMRRKASKKAISEITKAEGVTFTVDQIINIIKDLPKKCKEILEQFDAKEDIQSLFEKVDIISREDLFNVVENRNALARALGSKVYPILFGEFSEGERLFNRTWSALCDKHIEEARTSLSGALESFKRVSIELDKISSY